MELQSDSSGKDQSLHMKAVKYKQICKAVKMLPSFKSVRELDENLTLPHILMALSNYSTMNDQLLPNAIELMTEIQNIEDHLDSAGNNTMKHVIRKRNVCNELMKNKKVIDILINLLPCRNESKHGRHFHTTNAPPEHQYLFNGHHTLQPEYETRILELEQDISTLELQSVCKVCISNEAVILCLPCAHISTCPSCTTRLHKCPLCRTEIRATVHTYRS